MPATAMLPCCAACLVLVLAALAHPVVAGYAVNSMPCPSAIGDIVTVLDGSDLSVVFAMNGTGKTYLLEPGSYSLPSQIKPAITAPSTTCFIGGGARGDVVITATSDIAADAPAFFVENYLYQGGFDISLGLKHLILDNGANAAGVHAEGEAQNAIWSVEDVTIRHGTGGLYYRNTRGGSPQLANVTVAYVQGQGRVTDAAVNVYSPSLLQWRDLAVTDCNGVQSAVSLGGPGTMSGRLLVARNRGSTCGMLYLVDNEFTFTGDVILEGNEGVPGVPCSYEGVAVFDSATARFTESSTVLVRHNVVHGNGGGFTLATATLHVLGPARFTNNTADGVGGAVWTFFSSIDFDNSVCITQNTAAGGGSGIYIFGAGTFAFNSPSSAQIGGNSPVDSTIFVATDDASWTCSGSGAPRGQGNYSITGPPCACEDASGGASACPCPAANPYWDSAACACAECLGSPPCCVDTKLEPCTRSLQLTPNNAASSVCEAVEVVATVTDTGATGANTVPAANVPVTFAADGDCDPDMRTRTVYTDAQGRARIVLRAHKPGTVVVVATVRSDEGSLPTQVVKAVTHIRFWPCHPADREPGASYGDEEHDAGGHGRRPEYKHTSRAHRYEADGMPEAHDGGTAKVTHDAVTAEAFEAVATQMALQAMGEREAARPRP